MMPLQRVWDAENRMRNKLSNGPLRAQSNGFSQSILRRCRQTSYAGDMLDPAKRTGHAVNQGGTADSVVYSSLTDSIFLSRTFLCDTGNPVLRTPLTEIKSEEFFIKEADR